MFTSPLNPLYIYSVQTEPTRFSIFGVERRDKHNDLNLPSKGTPLLYLFDSLRNKNVSCESLEGDPSQQQRPPKPRLPFRGILLRYLLGCAATHVGDDEHHDDVVFVVPPFAGAVARG
jgi:hypothetical protein